jgi:hypothetical protein|tara:strand:- start:510 stop:815 length:306 start_codon:yes stop_codon:yes gene_type:complete
MQEVSTGQVSTATQIHAIGVTIALPVSGADMSAIVNFKKAVIDTSTGNVLSSLPLELETEGPGNLPLTEAQIIEILGGPEAMVAISNKLHALRIEAIPTTD